MANNKNTLTEEMLTELASDFEMDAGLHTGQIFNDWRQRHGISGVSIKDVSYLLKGLK